MVYLIHREGMGCLICSFVYQNVVHVSPLMILSFEFDRVIQVEILTKFLYQEVFWT